MQPGDERQDVCEHLPRHRDLGHLERDVAAAAHHLGPDLDQLIDAPVSRFCRHVLGLSVMAGGAPADARTGRNGRHALVGLLRQSVFGRAPSGECGIPSHGEGKRNLAGFAALV